MWNEFLATDPWVRALVYAALGCTGEVIFTGTMDVLQPRFLSSWNVHSRAFVGAAAPDWYEPRDGRAVGYSFLWMLPVYAAMIFLEPLYEQIKGLPWFVRGLIYLLNVWFAEAVSGWLIRAISGRVPWDYSYSRFSVKGLIRWDFAPVWLGFGFIFEFLYPRLLALTPSIRQIFF